VLANGAYTHRAPLSRPVGVASELRGKLGALGFLVEGADDQSLDGMKGATDRWLKLVENAVEEAEAAKTEEEVERSPLLLFFAFCGHGCAGRFHPVDVARGSPLEESYCFFDDFLFRLYEKLGEGYERFGRKRPPKSRFSLEDTPREVTWYLPGVRIVAVIESCRRLSPEEQQAYEAQRSRIASGKRHLLPSMAALRPDLAHMGGAEWDAARLAFLSELGPGAPRLLLALSSESTTPSYDVVFLRSITEAIDRPVRLGGILERASLDTLRRTGHKQKPVLLTFGGGWPGRGGIGDGEGGPALLDLVLATPPPICPGPPASRPPMLRKCRSASSCSALEMLNGSPSGIQHSLPRRRPRAPLPALP